MRVLLGKGSRLRPTSTGPSPYFIPPCNVLFGRAGAPSNSVMPCRARVSPGKAMLGRACACLAMPCLAVTSPRSAPPCRSVSGLGVTLPTSPASLTNQPRQPTNLATQPTRRFTKHLEWLKVAIYTPFHRYPFLNDTRRAHRAQRSCRLSAIMQRIGNR